MTQPVKLALDGGFHVITLPQVKCTGGPSRAVYFKSLQSFRGIFAHLIMSSSLMHCVHFIPQDRAFSTLPTVRTQNKEGWHSHTTEIAGLHEEERIATLNSGYK